MCFFYSLSVRQFTIRYISIKTRQGKAVDAGTANTGFGLDNCVTYVFDEPEVVVGFYGFEDIEINSLGIVYRFIGPRISNGPDPIPPTPTPSRTPTPTPSPKRARGPVKTLKWEKGRFGTKCNSAVLGGFELNGRKVFVARATVGGELTVGKMVVEAQGAFMPYGGRVRSFFSYEVLCNPDGARLVWKDSSGVAVPPNAVVGGRSRNGDPQYVGRARFQTIWVPGKKLKSAPYVLYPYGSTERFGRKFQILCYAD